MTEIPRYDTWDPLPIPDRELVLDFQIMRTETREPWCICIVSKFRDPKNRLEQDKTAMLVPVLTVNAYGISPQAAQYEAFKQASYFLNYGVLPAPEQLRLPGNLYQPTEWDDELDPFGNVRVIDERDLKEGPI